jgi:hypothetical protein
MYVSSSRHILLVLASCNQWYMYVARCNAADPMGTGVMSDDANHTIQMQ